MSARAGGPRGRLARVAAAIVALLLVAVAAPAAAAPSAAAPDPRPGRYSFLPVLGGSVLFLGILAAAILARRARARRRRDHLVARREHGERRARIARAAARRAPESLRGGRVLDDEALQEAAAADPEVPRVEHDGRWYTLH